MTRLTIRILILVATNHHPDVATVLALKEGYKTKKILVLRDVENLELCLTPWCQDKCELRLAIRLYCRSKSQLKLLQNSGSFNFNNDCKNSKWFIFLLQYFIYVYPNCALTMKAIGIITPFLMHTQWQHWKNSFVLQWCQKRLAHLRIFKVLFFVPSKIQFQLALRKEWQW